MARYALQQHRQRRGAPPPPTGCALACMRAMARTPMAQKRLNDKVNDKGPIDSPATRSRRTHGAAVHTRGDSVVIYHTAFPQTGVNGVPRVLDS